jgi:hypothetical protein
MRMMFLDPDGKAIAEREAAEHREPGTLSLLVKHNIEDLAMFVRVCQAENPNVVARVSVRLYDMTPALNGILIDSRVAFVHHYGTHSRGFDAPTLIVTDQAADILEFYANEFESLWALGTPMKLRVK